MPHQAGVASLTTRLHSNWPVASKSWSRSFPAFEIENELQAAMTNPLARHGHVAAHHPRELAGGTATVAPLLQATRTIPAGACFVSVSCWRATDIGHRPWSFSKTATRHSHCIRALPCNSRRPVAAAAISEKRFRRAHF